MLYVLTPDGEGRVLQAESARGRTSYLVKGAGFEGWYDSLQVQADWDQHPDEVIPNEDMDTVLPYQSRPQGPGWDGTTSTIQPNIDPQLDIEGQSNSLDGKPTDESAVDADIEGLFEPHSRISRVRHTYAKTTDPILDVSRLPEESPTTIDNSPINPDDVDTDDAFNGSRPHFERSSATYDRLTIEDDLAFLRFAAEDGDGPKEDADLADNGPEDETSDDKPDEDSDSPEDDPDDGPDSLRNDRRVAAVALTTTADLHFLANLCTCAEALPLHSLSEHREIKREAFDEKIAPQKSPESRGPLPGVTPQTDPTQDELDERIQEHQPYHQTPLVLVEHDNDKEDGADSYNQPYDGKTEADKWNHEGDTRSLISSVQKQADGYDKYIGSNGDGTFHLIASGDGKLPKGEHYGHYDSHEAAHDAVRAIIERNHTSAVKTAAPAQPAQPTQIESQIEQLMQFWAVDNNGWWHWTGSQSDLALLNQMQQQMTMVGMPAGAPGAMQAQSAVAKYAAFAVEANVPEEWRSYLQLVASDRLVALAAWRDVVDKSKRLRAEGAIDVEAFRPDVITAHVQGDHGRYYTTVQRLGGVPGGKQLTSGQVSGWSCDCDWGQWAWLRKRSFVGRMCSHAYALFTEMRSLDARARKTKGKPIKSAAVTNKTAWTRNPQGGFDWVSDDPMAPTAVVAKTAAGWEAHVWSDGTAEDSLGLGRFGHSEQARRAAAVAIVAHVKLADDGDVDLVGGQDDDDYTADSSIPGGMDDPEQNKSDKGIQNSSSTLTAFAEHDDGDDDKGPESHDDGVEEDDHDDDESVDEEVARDESGNDDSDGFADSDGVDSDDDRFDDQDGKDADDDGGHDEPHKRHASDDDEGTDNPGDESDDDGIEKTSSVAELQKQYGLSHLAGANYSPTEQANLVGEGEGKTARNRSDLNLTGTHYEGSSEESPEDTLAFLF